MKKTKKYTKIYRWGKGGEGGGSVCIGLDIWASLCLGYDTRPMVPLGFFIRYMVFF